MKSNPNPKLDHGAPCVANCTRSANKVKPTDTAHDPTESSYSHYPPLPSAMPTDVWTKKSKHIIPASTVPITNVSKTRLIPPYLSTMQPPSKHYKPGHGARTTNLTRSAELPDIKPKTHHAPYPPLPNPPPSAYWSSKLKHIRKLSSVPITHPPSMTRNAKSKRKSKNNDQDQATASDLMIVGLPSTFKPPSKTAKPKSKSVYTPQNDNDTDKETLPSPDTYCILAAVHTQWLLFRFKNVPPSPKMAATPAVNVDEYVPWETASHQKSIPPFFSTMLHWKIPLYPLC
eukprot:scaffold10540_cov38-Attheya_sp.AAC.1